MSLGSHVIRLFLHFKLPELRLQSSNMFVSIGEAFLKIPDMPRRIRLLRLEIDDPGPQGFDVFVSAGENVFQLLDS